MARPAWPALGRAMRAAALTSAVAASAGGVIGCGRHGVAARSADPAEGPAALDRRIAGLRLALADRPRDPDLHRALGRALLRAGRPGGALRHLGEVDRRRDLVGDDGALLARLHLDRARARLALGDGAARRDIDAALRIDPHALERVADGRAIAFDADLAGALAALRRGDGPARREARRLLDRAAARDPDDARLAARDPAAADLDRLGIAGAWLADGGARRAALALYEEYVARGGTDAAHLRRHAALHRWWHGDRERPTPRVLAAMRAAGIDPCAHARTEDELGCGAALVIEATRDPARAETIRRRAAARGWRTADPDAAAAWVLVALRGWIEGRVGSWEAEIAARVDLAALAGRAGLAGVPEHARPTLLRAAGRAGPARAALDRLSTRARQLGAEARAVAVAEAVAQERGSRAIDALLASGPVADEGWRAALIAARSAGPEGREATLLAAAPPAAARAHLLAGGALGALAARDPAEDVTDALHRWRAALADARDPRLAAARDQLEARWRRLGSAVEEGQAAPDTDASARSAAATPTETPIGPLAGRSEVERPTPAREREPTVGQGGRPWRAAPEVGTSTAPPAGRPARAATRPAEPARAPRIEARPPSRHAVAPLPLGVLDLRRLVPSASPALRAALAAIARAHLRDPALADRQAADFVDGAIALGQRAPLLVDLYARLGDPARALAWAERLLASSPDHAPALLLAAQCAAAAGDAPRADVLFVRGASASGDPGGASVLASRSFLAAGLALPALGAARRALDLTAPGEPARAQAIALAARALELLGRADQAGPLVASLSPAAQIQARIDAGLAPPPDVAAAAAALPPPGDPGWPIAIAAALAAALIAPPARAAPMLIAIEDSLYRAGLARLAQAVRRERIGLAPLDRWPISP